MQPHRRQPSRLHRPWDSPGENTGVGCHFLLQCRKVKSESEVAQSCLTLSDPMDCSPPGSSIHGIFQARVLEWGAIAFSERTYKNGFINCPVFFAILPSLQDLSFLTRHWTQATCSESTDHHGIPLTAFSSSYLNWKMNFFSYYILATGSFDIPLFIFYSPLGWYLALVHLASQAIIYCP